MYSHFITADQRTKTWGKKQPVPKWLLRKIEQERIEAGKAKALESRLVS